METAGRSRVASLSRLISVAVIVLAAALALYALHESNVRPTTTDSCDPRHGFSEQCAIDDIMAAETFASFGPDLLVEAKNRCYRPCRHCIPRGVPAA